MEMLNGIIKIAISAWYTKLMALSPQARSSLLSNWNTKDAVRLLGSGAKNVTGQKANYKVLANAARQHAAKVMPGGQGAAGHGMKHIFDVTGAAQIASGARKFIGAGKGASKLTGYAMNAPTTNPLQRQAVLSALLHDTGKAGEKALRSTAAGKAMFEANPYKYSHATTGARNAMQFFGKNRELAMRAGLNKSGQSGMSGARDVSRAILGHNPATWKNPAGAMAAETQGGRLLRFADDIVGNTGAVGLERTVGFKGLPTSVQGIREAGTRGLNFALDKNRAAYDNILHSVPSNMRPYARANAMQYWHGLNMAANQGILAAHRFAPGQQLMRKSWDAARGLGTSPINPSSVRMF